MASRTPTPLRHPDTADLDLLTVLNALSDPVRLGMVVKLAGNPGLTCGGFYPHLTASVLTRHFRVLREAGLIRQHDAGTRRENVLRRADLDTRFPGLIDLLLTEAAAGRIPPPPC